MSVLQELGVTVRRRYVSSSSSVNGVQIGGQETTELTLTLPRATSMKARFSKEGIAQQVVKLFKREIQTGDRQFDAAIYIATDTPEVTANFLVPDGIRAEIASLVNMGGPIQIDGATVSVVVAGHDEDGEDPGVVALVRALLA